MDSIKIKYPHLKPIIEIIQNTGIKKLYEHQRKGLRYALSGKNVLMATPTSSGKTLVAELSIINTVLNGKKAIYLVPLKSLATEKYKDFKKKYSKYAKIALSIGGFDSKDMWLKGFDVIICSYEKLDSLLRHKSEWLKDVKLVVIDEIHMIDSMSRGPTLEVLITRLRTEITPQIIALSATIKNAEDMGKWLKAKTIKNNFRPVKLYEGVAYESNETKNKTILEFPKDNIIKEFSGKNVMKSICIDTIKNGKQAILFVSTRRSSEVEAKKVGTYIKDYLSEKEKKKLSELSKKILSVLPHPTEQCKKLSEVIKFGVAFDHAGLVTEQKNLIEDAFRNGLIKIITSTPVLSYGVSLPAFRVIIRDVKRFSEAFGSHYISTMDYLQMSGRAGRLGKEDFGESIIITTSGEKDKIIDRYIYGEMEEIYSKLAVEPVLRTHTLSLISSELTRDISQLKDFFSKTFFSYQYGDTNKINGKLESITKNLSDHKFIKIESDSFIRKDFIPAFKLNENYKLIPTHLGKRVSELYIDPESAWFMIKNLNNLKDEINILMILNQCVEMYPLLRLKKSEYEDYEDLLLKSNILNIPDVWDLEYDKFLMSFKTSLMFMDWMNEMSEEYIMKKYNVRPGDLYSKLLSMDWMLYSLIEILKILRKRELANKINKLRLRIKYGVKSELLPLVKIKWIGRIKARRLFNEKIKNISDIKSNLNAKRILGEKTFEKIIKEFEGS